MDIPDTLPAGQYVIYALFDPTDESVYYVGQTLNPKERLEAHMVDRHHKGAKGEWLRRLSNKGQQPLMQILEIALSREAALAKEQEWIRHFQGKGMPLLNGKGGPAPGIQPIIPLRQKTIFLFGYPVVVVLLPDEYTAASLSSLCKMLKIARNGQIRRIRRDNTLSAGLATALIQTIGGPQVQNVLIDWAVPIWASGLRVTALLEEQQALALRVKLEAFAEIEQRFTRP